MRELRAGDARPAPGDNRTVSRLILHVPPAVVVIACAPSPVDSQAGTIEEIEGIEQQLAAAWVASDRAAIERLIADDWVTTDLAGRVRTKAQVLEEMFATGKTPVASMAIDDVRVRVFGDLAVVTGRTVASGADGAAVRLRFTDVLARRDGRWQFVASQGTQITE